MASSDGVNNRNYDLIKVVLGFFASACFGAWAFVVDNASAVVTNAVESQSVATGELLRQFQQHIQQGAHAVADERITTNTRIIAAYIAEDKSEVRDIEKRLAACERRTMK